MAVCFGYGFDGVGSYVAVHEQFHAFQWPDLQWMERFAALEWSNWYGSTKWLIEAAANAVAGVVMSGSPTKYLGSRPASLDAGFLKYVNNGYLVRDLWLHMLRTDPGAGRLGLELFRHLFGALNPVPQTGRGLGNHYWRWARYLAIEGDVDLGDGLHASGA